MDCLYLVPNLWGKRIFCFIFYSSISLWFLTLRAHIDTHTCVHTLQNIHTYTRTRAYTHAIWFRRPSHTYAQMYKRIKYIHMWGLMLISIFTLYSLENNMNSIIYGSHLFLPSNRWSRRHYPCHICFIKILSTKKAQSSLIVK